MKTSKFAFEINWTLAKAIGFKILSKLFKNSETVCSFDKIPNRQFDEYQIKTGRTFVTEADGSRIPVLEFNQNKVDFFCSQNKCK